jgi:F0F1-type ATP synthase membrane subunit b/b'
MILFALAENFIQLVPDGTLLVHIVIVVVMVLILNLTLFQPINRILEQRELQTRGRLSEAQATLARVKEKIDAYERELRAARAEGYHLLEQERAEALRERAKQIAALKEEIGTQLGVQKAMLTSQAEDVRQTLGIEARRIGMEIGVRILGRPVSESDIPDIRS